MTDCPVCGHHIEWCLGHTLWHDPYGWLIQRMHNHGVHAKCASACVPAGVT